MVDLILPSSIFIEKDFKLINLENFIKKSQSLRKFSGDVRPEWYLLLVLISFFDRNFYKSKLSRKSIFNFRYNWPS